MSNRIIPFISVDHAEEAITVYQAAFQATIVGETTYYSEFEPEASYADKIAHCTLSIFDSTLFINDAVDQIETTQERFTISLEVPKIEHVIQSFTVLKPNAKHIYYEPTELPWSSLGYTLKDSFGVIWMVYQRD